MSSFGGRNPEEPGVFTRCRGFHAVPGVALPVHNDRPPSCAVHPLRRGPWRRSSRRPPNPQATQTACIRRRPGRACHKSLDQWNFLSASQGQKSHESTHSNFRRSGFFGSPSLLVGFRASRPRGTERPTSNVQRSTSRLQARARTWRPDGKSAEGRC